MAVKTITIDMDAYEALRRHKRGGQSFSDVIKEHFRGRTTGQTLLNATGTVSLHESTLNEIDRIVAERAQEPARDVEL
jgi:predicted CopG family antitoxin